MDDKDLVVSLKDLPFKASVKYLGELIRDKCNR